MDVTRFDYELPPRLIAQKPVSGRDTSRLLVFDRREKRITEDVFKNIGDYLTAGDVLVINETRVRPARLLGYKKTGGKLEVLLLNPADKATEWYCLVKPGRSLQNGMKISFGSQKEAATVLHKTVFGGRVIRFSSPEVLAKVIHETGHIPLPPYIKEPLADPELYQTVYGKEEGSVAAPTAGLHFTRNLMEKLQKKGIIFAPFILHIGLGTFRPVQTEHIEDHEMHAEFMIISRETAGIINTAKREGRRIIATGTTAVRSLETAADENGLIKPWLGWTDLFIYPGYNFRVVDSMITNFHLPRSTLLMLVCAFAEYEQIMAVYNYALKKEYRFYSFGDAMLIL